MKHQKRKYRDIVNAVGLKPFKLKVMETDLHIQAALPLRETAKELVLESRRYIENYIYRYPDFKDTLVPWENKEPAPKIIRDMVRAGKMTGVGPMAAVAGAIAEHVGNGLLEHCDEVIVENGGDIFFQADNPITMGIYAGSSPLSMRIGLLFRPGSSSMGVCTSSGTIGHSLSKGKADAVTVLSDSCPLSDAAATSIGNLVKNQSDIETAIEFGKQIKEIRGIMVIVNDKVGAWGDLEVVSLGHQPRS